MAEKTETKKAKVRVTVYSTDSCPYCVMLKEFLDANKVKYTEHNVGEDQEKANEMIEISGQMGVPVTLIEKDDKEYLIIGFDKLKLSELLGIK